MAAGLPVVQLIRALPGIGTVQAQSLMERLGISVRRHVRGLGPNRRAALLEAVRDR